LLCIHIVVEQIEVAVTAIIVQDADDDADEGAAGVVERG
jgi:hypothetical protein